jgi:outer membrane receptor protein involved in Fe transport
MFLPDRSVRLLLRAVLLVVVSAAGASALAAQGTGSITGAVTTSDSAAPLSSVSVIVEGTGRTAVTDAEGRFHLDGVPAGTLSLLARRIGYAPDRRTIALPADSALRVNFVLTPIVVRLEDIVVSATREAENRMDVPASIGVVSGDQIRASKPTHPQEVMDRVAGVYVPVTGGEGHMMAIRQPMTTDPVYLYLEDGIPTRSTGFFNHNALYEINIPQADRIEVTKGPASALYGSDAIGGVINVSTRAPSPIPQVETSVDAGAYGWGRFLGSASNTWGRSGLRADINLTRTSGWRDATGYDRQSGTLRWDQSVGESGNLKTVATFSRIDQTTAGTSAISAEDYADDPTINYTPISVRQVRAFRYSMAYSRGGELSSFEATPYVRYDWMRLIPNWSLTYDPTDYTDQNKSAGLMLKYRRNLPALRTQVIIGADAEYSPGSHVEHAIVPTREGRVFTSYTTGDLLYDYDVAFRGVSPYTQLQFTPLPKWRIDAGARMDFNGFSYTSALTPLATGRWRRPADTTVSYSHLSPKLGATYEAAPELNLFVSWRNGFRAPSQSQIFRQGSADNTVGLHPVLVNSYETGVRGRIAHRLDYDVSVYDMIKTDDILSYTFPDGHTEVMNAGRTTHRGIEVSLGAQMVPDFRLDVAYSYARHRFGEWSTTDSVDLSGNEIPSAPRQIANVSATVTPSVWAGARFMAELQYLGAYWEDQADTHRYPGHALVNLHATAPIGRGFSVSARIMNLFDRRYAELANYTIARGEELAPGMPRRLYLSAEYDFQ